jgi:hypothetical protein
MKCVYIFILFLWITSCNSPVYIESEAAPDDSESIIPNPDNTELKTDEKNAECGTDNPQENLPWLKAWIEKAETDQTGNLKGTIWLVSYNGKDVFVTNMMLGSGGIAYWLFDCSGNCFVHKGEESSYLPLHYAGNGYAFVEDETEIFSYISTLRLGMEEENKDIPVIYSNMPH